MMTEHRVTVRQQLALHVDCETIGLRFDRDQVIEVAMPRPDDVVAIVHHHGRIEGAPGCRAPHTPPASASPRRSRRTDGACSAHRAHPPLPRRPRRLP